MKRYLSRLILENIGLHEIFSCNFNKSINVISGASGVGKSWIIRAIKSVLFNRPAIDSLRRTGSKKSSITLVYSDGVEIERNFSKSINRYTLRVPNQDEKVFDSVGRDVPEEIQQLVSAYPIKIDSSTFYLPLQDQFRNQWFLFDENIAGATKNKLFNLLTGNDVLDNLFKDLNKDILAEGRSIKHLEKDLEDKQSQLDNVTLQLNEKTNVLGNVQEMLTKLNQNYTQFTQVNEKYEKLQNLKNDCREIDTKIATLKSIKNNRLEKISDTISTIALIRTKHAQFQEIASKLGLTITSLSEVKITPNTDEIEKCIDYFTSVKDICRKINENNVKLQQIDKNIKAVPMVPKKIAEFPLLQSTIDNLSKIMDINTKLKALYENRAKLDTKIESLQIEINKGEKEFKSVLKEAGVCPLCGSTQT